MLETMSWSAALKPVFYMCVSSLISKKNEKRYCVDKVTDKRTAKLFKQKKKVEEGKITDIKFS